jgi:hypothetical protein
MASILFIPREVYRAKDGTLDENALQFHDYEAATDPGRVPVTRLSKYFV